MNRWSEAGSARAARRRTALVLWLAALAVATLVPQSVIRADAHLRQLSLCLVCGDRGTSDAILNVLLFVPLGLLLDRRRWHPRRALLAGILLSLSIEAIQHFVPGRYSNLGDVVWNGVGAWLGSVLISHGASWLPPAPLWGRKLAAMAMLVPTLGTLALGWLMEPTWPREPYWGQWTPDLGSMDHYDGTVVQADLDTLAVPPGRFPPGAHPRDVLTGDWTLDVIAVKGDAPPSFAPILSIYNQAEEEVVMLGARGQDLVYSEGSRARSLRFAQPDLRRPGVLAAAAVGDTIALGVGRRGPRRCLIFDGREACLGFTPGRGWSLFMYSGGLPAGMGRLLDGLWLFLLFLPVGLWSDALRGVVLRGLAAALGVGIAVWLTRLVIPPPTELAAAALGAFVGHRLWVAWGRVLRAEARDPTRA